MSPLLLLTDRASCRVPLPAVLAAAVAAGARLVLLREKDLPAPRRALLAEQVAALLAPVGGRLVLAGGSLPFPAVHLAAGEAEPVPRPELVGRSCHSAAEVAAAAGCDWVTLSPVFASASKPGYGPALGTAALAVGSAPPVYALGGVTAANAASCLAGGAAGVAVMGEVMRSPDPGQVVADLLAALR